MKKILLSLVATICTLCAVEQTVWVSSIFTQIAINGHVFVFAIFAFTCLCLCVHFNFPPLLKRHRMTSRQFIEKQTAEPEYSYIYKTYLDLFITRFAKQLIHWDGAQFTASLTLLLRLKYVYYIRCLSKLVIAIKCWKQIKTDGINKYNSFI